MNPKNKTQLNMPELLAPAGDMEKLKTAFHFGADAVYLAGKDFGLRAYAGNFSISDIAAAVAYAHALDKKVYVTVNIFAKNDDFSPLENYLRELGECGVDALIISDAGVFSLARRVLPQTPIHISTQANTINMHGAAFWQQAGASRVVLAREMSLTEIAETAQFCPKLELETFVHGAMCVSYSGRCLLSDYLTGRKSNRGECVQACRWSYKLLPEGRDAADALEIAEDVRGSYILNSKDLCMIAHLDKLIEAGVKSFKIEGRMKSPYYVATVVNAYRRAIDGYFSAEAGGIGGAGFNGEQYLAELANCSHRSYETGFFLPTGQPLQYYKSSKAAASAVFCAVVKAYDAASKRVLVEMRNSFKIGDEMQILSRGQSFQKSFIINQIVSETGETIEDCRRVQQLVWLNCPHEVLEFDILRRAE